MKQLNHTTNPGRVTGWLLIAGAIGVLVPYTILNIIFQYPSVLRQDTSTVLTKFNEGGNPHIWVWFAFAIGGIPLLPAYIRIGQTLEGRTPLVRVATTIGVIGLVVQVIGLLRWTFVVPLLATTFVNATDEATKAAAIVAFKTIHQFAGVMLGEHLGQLFTITWTLLISISFRRLGIVSNWISRLGIGSSLIYLLAQAELFSTVMPGFPQWSLAGFVGSTLWLVWLVVTGIELQRNMERPQRKLPLGKHNQKYNYTRGFRFITFKA